MRTLPALPLLALLTSLLTPACGEDPPGGGTQSGGSDSETTPAPTTTQDPTTGLPTPTTTDSAGTTAASSSAASTDDPGSSTTSDDTTDTTATTDTDTSTGDPLDCRPRADIIAKPLPDPTSEDRLMLFARPDGYHLFYLVQTPAFETRIIKLDAEGAAAGPSSFVASPDLWRHTATSGTRYAAATSTFSVQSYKGDVVVADIQPDDTLTLLNSAPVPSDGFGTGVVALAWNPVDGEWGVLWEDQYNIDPNMPGYIHARLAFGRVTADGAWVDGSTMHLTTADTTRSVKLSDWSNPLIWAGDRYAAVWAEYGPNTTDVFLGELAADGAPTRVLLDQGDFSRGVPAWDGAGYGVAWGHWDFGDHYNLRFAYVEDGEVGEHLHLGDDEIYSGDASIVATADGFTVSWHETSNDTSRLFYARIDPHTLAAETVQVTEQGFDGHDWSQALVHDGCRHALAHMHGINPADAWLHLFD
jgi:hypothetical protein